MKNENKEKRGQNDILRINVQTFSSDRLLFLPHLLHELGNRMIDSDEKIPYSKCRIVTSRSAWPTSWSKYFGMALIKCYITCHGQTASSS